MNAHTSHKLWVKVTPNSPTNRLGALQKNPKDQWLLKVYLKAVPEKGKANQQLKVFLAECWDLSVSDITILQGETARLKLIEVQGTLPHIFH
jgi:uncharacterized protein YggU (UPF0235/DUF167 family)